MAYDEMQIEDTSEFEIAEERIMFEDHMRNSALWTDEDIEEFNARHPE